MTPVGSGSTARSLTPNNGREPARSRRHPSSRRHACGQLHDDAGDEVLALIADVGGYSVTALADRSGLADDLGYDSLLQLRLLDRLRAEYPQLQDVTVAEVLPKIHSVGDLVDFVVQRLG